VKPSSLITIALILGGIAAFVVSRWIGIGGSSGSGPQVVVASANIEPGVAISASQITSVRWPSVAPPGSSSDAASLVGRVPKQIVYAGEPVLESKLAAKDAKGGLASTISPGKRAISVRVNDVIAVAGFTLPGSVVDVMVSAKDADGAPFSKIVLTRVRVLAIAQETAPDQTKPKVVNAVTLELTPGESEQLDLARSIGSLSLVLRNELDIGSVTSSGSRLGDLISSGAVGARQQPSSGPSTRAAPPAVQEIRGVNIKRDGAAL